MNHFRKGDRVREDANVLATGRVLETWGSAVKVCWDHNPEPTWIEAAYLLPVGYLVDPVPVQQQRP